MSENRFNELLSGLLDGELSANELTELAGLTRGNPAREREIQAQLETAEMIALSEDTLRDPALFLTAIRSRLSEDSFVARVRSGIRPTPGSRVWRALNPWSLATAAAIAVCGIGLFIWQFGRDAAIAQLVRASGPIQWTGNGGVVERPVVAGRTLTGGTLETLAWDSSATVAFPDQTAVTLYGASTLTLTAGVRKTLHLRAGNLEAKVLPQPTGRSLIVHTPVADLEVLGTQFSIATDEEQTKLAVRQGEVRLFRRSDGTKVGVRAEHLVVASMDNRQALVVTPMISKTNDWTPVLAQDVEHGEWISAFLAWRREVGRAVRAGEMTLEDAERDFRTRVIHLPEDAGSVYARPARLSDAGEMTSLISLSATRGFHGPIYLTERGRFRVRGVVQLPTLVTFAFSAIDPIESTGVRYMLRRQVQGNFDLELPVTEFRPFRGSASAAPTGKQLVGWHCFTSDREADLTINAVELSGPK